MVERANPADPIGRPCTVFGRNGGASACGANCVGLRQNSKWLRHRQNLLVGVRAGELAAAAGIQIMPCGWLLYADWLAAGEGAATAASMLEERSTFASGCRGKGCANVAGNRPLGQRPKVRALRLRSFTDF